MNSASDGRSVFGAANLRLLNGLNMDVGPRELLHISGPYLHRHESCGSGCRRCRSRKGTRCPHYFTNFMPQYAIPIGDVVFSGADQAIIEGSVVAPPDHAGGRANRNGNSL
jgi:hypothetical protein